MSNITFMQCPACEQEISARALKCSYCGELLRDYRECPQCAERVRSRARTCRYCAQPLAPVIPVIAGDPGDESAAPAVVPPAYLAASTPLGALFCHRSLTGLILPPELFVTATDVEMHWWSLFGMRSFDQKVPFSRVTSVRLVQGIFWGSILLETFGGPVAELELRGMNKREARDLAKVIDEYVHTRRATETAETRQESA
jgi:predicted amidophosphoribosyltransferase